MMGSLGWALLAAWGYLVTVAGVRAVGYYHQATPDKTCHVSVPEWSTLDLVCQYFDKGTKRRSCRMRSMTWQKLGVRTVTNVTDSPKYGLWEAIPGWGMGDGEHISLLRIRSLEPADLGTYRCEIQCVDEDGIRNKAYHYADVCLQQPNKNYAICSSHVSNGYCAAAFWNGVCDLDCETEKNLFDGFECIDKLDPCDPTFEGYCSSKFANGICDTNCNTPECAWDGGDCISTPRRFAEDTLVLFLSNSGWRRRSSGAIDLKELGRSLSKLLRTIVRVLPANWDGEHMHIQPDERTASHNMDSPSGADAPSFSGGRRLFLKLDNTQCRKKCFRKAQRAAQYIMAAIQNGWDPGIPITSVAVLGERGHQCRMENNSLLNIDLSKLDQDGSNMGYKGNGGYGFHSWILVAAVTGGICLIVLIMALTLVACRLQNSSSQSSPEKRRPHGHDPGRIHMEKQGKYGPPGTDV